MTKASTYVIRLEEELEYERRKVQALEAVIWASREPGTSAIPPWFKKLSEQEGVLMMSLAAIYPRAANRDAIDSWLPKQDHVKDRGDKFIDVVIHNVRKKLGFHAIERMGVGLYRCSEAYAVNPSAESKKPEGFFLGPDSTQSESR